MSEITPDLLKRIVPTMPRAKRELYAPLIQAACIEFDITNEPRVAAFLSQLAHESDHFNTLSEYASGAAYDNRRDLGNTKAEAIAAAKRHGTTPGRFYKGHGAIQTTGYNNHKEVGEFLGVDAVENPSILATPEYAFRSAGYFWDRNKLNRYADRREIRAVSGIVNAGSPVAKRINGLAERVTYYERALAALPDDFKLTDEAPEVDDEAVPDVTQTQVAAEEKEGAQKSQGTSGLGEKEDEVAGTMPPAQAQEVKASDVPFWTRVSSLSIPAGVIGVLTAIGKFIGNLPPYVWVAFSVLMLAGMIIGFLIWRQRDNQAHERTKIVLDAAADKDKNNLRLI